MGCYSNTAFFHAYVKNINKQRKVEMLKLSSEEWCSDASVLKEEVVRHFSNLYTQDEEEYKPWDLKGRFPKLTREEYSALACEVSKEEIKIELFQMGPLKAPGVDGVHAFFFQKNWSVVGDSVCNLVRQIFDGGVIDDAIC